MCLLLVSTVGKSCSHDDQVSCSLGLVSPLMVLTLVLSPLLAAGCVGLDWEGRIIDATAGEVAVVAVVAVVATQPRSHANHGGLCFYVAACASHSYFWVIANALASSQYFLFFQPLEWQTLPSSCMQVQQCRRRIAYAAKALPSRQR